MSEWIFFRSRDDDALISQFSFIFDNVVDKYPARIGIYNIADMSTGKREEKKFNRTLVFHIWNSIAIETRNDDGFTDTDCDTRWFAMSL